MVLGIDVLLQQRFGFWSASLSLQPTTSPAEPKLIMFLCLVRGGSNAGATTWSHYFDDELQTSPVTEGVFLLWA